jgi:25S rRNA (uracil2843-N3)-methyltransferase
MYWRTEFRDINTFLFGLSSTGNNTTFWGKQLWLGFVFFFCRSICLSTTGWQSIGDMSTTTKKTAASSSSSRPSSSQSAKSGKSTSTLSNNKKSSKRSADDQGEESLQKIQKHVELQQKLFGQIPEQAILNLFIQSCQDSIYLPDEDDEQAINSSVESMSLAAGRDDQLTSGNSTLGTESSNDTNKSTALTPASSPPNPTQRHTFNCRTPNPKLPTHLRTIKDLFLTRSYHTLFTNPELLPAYVVSYSPSRALCYWDMFIRSPALMNCLKKMIMTGRGGNVYSLGAGSGGEVIGLGAALVGMEDGVGRDTNTGQQDEDPSAGLSKMSLDSSNQPTAYRPINLHVQDIGDYADVFGKLVVTLSEPPFNLKGDRLNITSSFRDDILEFDQNGTSSSFDSKIQKIASADLITAMFLMNELLAESRKEFVKLVGLLVKHMKTGSLLLVVDSAGSFSEVTLTSSSASPSPSSSISSMSKPAKPTTSRPSTPQLIPAQTASAGRTYMVYHLLDKIEAFEIVEQTDSKWYRFPQELQFPLKLNNIRYFMRLYRKR